MNLTHVATKAATDASNAIGSTLTDTELNKVTTIIAKAMSMAVLEASSQHTNACVNCLSHEKDLAHKIQEEMELKKVALMANLSGFR
jgi:hypothetical protein